MLDILFEKNQEWAKSAPVLILSVTRDKFQRNGSPNKYSFYDVGQSVAYLSLQATAMNLYLHQMGGFSVEKAKSTFNIPDGFSPVSVFAVGYIEDSVAENRPNKIKNSIEDFVFEAGWNERPNLPVQD